MAKKSSISARFEITTHENTDSMANEMPLAKRFQKAERFPQCDCGGLYKNLYKKEITEKLTSKRVQRLGSLFCVGKISLIRNVLLIDVEKSALIF